MKSKMEFDSLVGSVSAYWDLGQTLDVKDVVYAVNEFCAGNIGPFFFTHVVSEKFQLEGFVVSRMPISSEVAEACLEPDEDDKNADGD